jgi:hypothetical protein
MAGLINRLGEAPDVRVVIRNAQGGYLAHDANGLFFSQNRTTAVVFSYRGDQIEEQLEVIRRSQGVVLTAEPVPSEEIYETCDRCKELFMPYMTFFDGKNFLCPDCRMLSLPRARP